MSSSQDDNIILIHVEYYPKIANAKTIYEEEDILKYLNNL
jgi:hypothetical protein